MPGKGINPETGKRYKSGGRKKGTKNKYTSIPTKVKELVRKHDNNEIQKFLDKNQTPLAFLTSVLNNEREDMKTRVDAAKAALPYVHGKKPSQVEVTGRDGKDLNVGNQTALDKLEGLLIEGIKQLDADNDENGEAMLAEYNEVVDEEKGTD